MEKVIGKIKDYIRRYRMIDPGDLVIAAVSGGPDSLALLHILRALQSELAFRLHVAHVDHCLRGRQAEEEADWVQKTAQEWGIPCTVTKIDVSAIAREKRLSIEEAGHFARKKYFLDLMQRIGAQKIALGHQADDQAETLLMHFLVGTGLEGLQGLAPVNMPLIRPLLPLRREEIELYCRENGLRPRRDPSNQDNAFLRNRIRNQVIPWLEEKINPNLVATLNRTAQIIQGDEAYLQRELAGLVPAFVKKTSHGSCLRLEGWEALHPSMQRRLIRYAYGEQNVAEKQIVVSGYYAEKKQGLSFGHVEEVRNFAGNGQTGKVLHLPGKVRVEKGYGELSFYHEKQGLATDGEEGEIKEQLLKIPGETFLPETGQRIITTLVEKGEQLATREGIKHDTLILSCNGNLPRLSVRSRKPGDRISVPGMTGTKKIKTIFNEKRIPLRRRNRILLICVEDNIIWIPQLKLVSTRIASDRGNNAGGDGKNRFLVVTIV